MNSFISPVMSVALGTAISFYSSQEVPCFFWFLLSLLLIGFALSIWGTKKHAFTELNLLRFHKAVLLLCLGLGLCFGIFLDARISLMKSESSLGMKPKQIRIVEANVLSDSGISSSGKRITQLRLEKVFNREADAVSANYDTFLITKSKEGGPFYWGEKVRLRVRMVKNGEFLYPRGDFLILRRWISPIFLYRRNIKLSLEESLQSLRTDTAGFFIALFTGCRNDLDIVEEENFRKAGCIHILALSGMHLGIISGLVAALFCLVFGRKWAHFSCILFILCFVFIAGLKPSLLRAAIMTGTFLLLTDCGYKPDILSLLSFSFIMIAVFLPESLESLSCKLSFLALTGILGLSGLIYRSFIHILPDHLNLALSASLSAQLVTAPFLAYTFGLVYPIGILASLVLTPLVLLFMWIGSIFLLFGRLPLLGSALGFSLDSVHTLITKTVGFFARFKVIHFEGREGLSFCISLLIITGLFLIRLFQDRMDRKGDLIKCQIKSTMHR